MENRDVQIRQKILRDRF